MKLLSETTKGKEKVKCVGKERWELEVKNRLLLSLINIGPLIFVFPPTYGSNILISLKLDYSVSL